MRFICLGGLLYLKDLLWVSNPYFARRPRLPAGGAFRLTVSFGPSGLQFMSSRETKEARHSFTHLHPARIFPSAFSDISDWVVVFPDPCSL